MFKPSSSSTTSTSTPTPTAVASMKSPALKFVLVCVLLDVIGFGLIIPVLPSLVGEFTSNAQSQARWYGVLMAAYGLAQFFAAPLLGALSDRFGRRPVLLLSQLGWGLDFLLIAFAPNLWIIFIARLIGGVTGAGFTVASAYVADVTSREERTRGMGMLGAMFGVGFIVGPMIGGFLGQIDVRAPFYAACAVALLNVAYGYFILPESLPKDKRTVYTGSQLIAKSNPFTAMAVLLRLPPASTGVSLGGLVLAIAVTNLAQFMMHTTFVLFTTLRFGWEPRDNGIALFTVGVLHAAVQGGLLGLLIKRLGDQRLALIAMSVAALEFLGFAMVTQGWMMYALILVAFINSAATPALMGLVSKNLPANEQGAKLGAISGLNAIMMVLAPLVATPIFAATNHFDKTDIRFGTVYLVAAALQALSVWLVWRALRNRV
jgi:MFS transporter, DHA1 family, tetracycline resistance protein